MSNFHPFFIPLSTLNNDKKCVTYNIQNFTGKVHITLDGVLFCSADYDGFEEDLEQAFDSFGLEETKRQLIRGVVPPADVVAASIINDDEAAAVAAATAAAAADGFNGELHHGEPMHVAQGIMTHMTTETYKLLNGIDGDDSTDGDEEEDGDTVTDLPSSTLEFDSDDDSYDEDRHFSQQASFFN